MSDLILIGGGGHCSSVIDVIENINEFKIRFILENKQINLAPRNYPYVFGDEKIYDYISEDVQFFITIGQIKSSTPRERLFKLVKDNGGKFATIKSRHSYISNAAQIGEGTFIGNGATINNGAVVGKNCIINTRSLIEHDASIGSHCHISTGSIINGDVEIGDRVFIDLELLFVHVKIGSGSIIGAGEVVKQDVSPNSLIKQEY